MSRRKLGLKEWALIVSIATGSMAGIAFLSELAVRGEQAVRSYIATVARDSVDCCGKGGR